MTIKQSTPPEGYTFTHARLMVLKGLHVPYKEIVTNWRKAGRGHWDPVITRAIPTTDVARVNLINAYYDRVL